MKKASFLLVLTLGSCIYSVAQQNPARLIIRGDDMGYSHSGNLALIKSYREGIEKSIEVIVPSPWFPEAVKMLEENPGVDAGVHLAITSEWDNIKWRPVSYCPSLTDSDGYFYPMVWPNKNYPGRSVSENKWKIEDIEKEFRAQIALAIKKIPRISHISAHMGCTNLTKEVGAIANKLAKEFNIDIDLNDYKVTGIGYDGDHTSFEEKKKSFMRMLDKLEAGKTYMFLDHPGLDDDELRAIHHIGYENVAEDRQGVTDLFTDPEIRAYINKKNIRLMAYKDLKN